VPKIATESQSLSLSLIQSLKVLVIPEEMQFRLYGAQLLMAIIGKAYIIGINAVWANSEGKYNFQKHNILREIKIKYSFNFGDFYATVLFNPILSRIARNFFLPQKLWPKIN
jgi:hypothetical protein